MMRGARSDDHAVHGVIPPLVCSQNGACLWCATLLLKHEVQQLSERTDSIDRLNGRDEHVLETRRVSAFARLVRHMREFPTYRGGDVFCELFRIRRRGVRFEQREATGIAKLSICSTKERPQRGDVCALKVD